MPKVVPGKAYKPHEIRALIDQSTAKELEFQGYVLQWDALSGTYSVVHWSKASQPFRQDGNRAQRRQVRKQVGPEAFGPLDPIVKRTPQQRTDSLMLKWITEMKKAGGMPSLIGDVPDNASVKERETIERNRANEKKLMDEKIAEIVGAAWTEGRTEITADVVRQVAAHFLGESEKAKTG